MLNTIHLSKKDVMAIIAKHFNTYTSEVHINYEPKLLVFGDCYTNSYDEEPLAIVRRSDYMEIDCVDEVRKYKDNADE